MESDGFQVLGHAAAALGAPRREPGLAQPHRAILGLNHHGLAGTDTQCVLPNCGAEQHKSQGRQSIEKRTEWASFCAYQYLWAAV